MSITPEQIQETFTKLSFQKPFLAKHLKTNEQRWCIKEIETGFLSPTFKYYGCLFLELDAPPIWHLRKPAWERTGELP